MAHSECRVGHFQTLVPTLFSRVMGVTNGTVGVLSIVGGLLLDLVPHSPKKNAPSAAICDPTLVLGPRVYT